MPELFTNRFALPKVFGFGLLITFLRFVFRVIIIAKSLQ